MEQYKTDEGSLWELKVTSIKRNPKSSSETEGKVWAKNLRRTEESMLVYHKKKKKLGQQYALLTIPPFSAVRNKTWKHSFAKQVK